MTADECVSDQALRMAKLDLSMDEPVQQARELADVFDALPQLDGTATFARVPTGLVISIEMRENETPPD
jgi:hypothetical protein